MTKSLERGLTKVHCGVKYILCDVLPNDEIILNKNSIQKDTYREGI